MNDSISRQAAIDAFAPYAEYESNRTNAEWVRRINMVLSALPSAQPGWIPVTERLPEEEGLYLVAGDFPPGAEVHIRYFNVMYDRSVWSGTMTDKVKWWMPIPNPPEGAQGEN